MDYVNKLSSMLFVNSFFWSTINGLGITDNICCELAVMDDMNVGRPVN